jgi:hypothetical protein
MRRISRLVAASGLSAVLVFGAGALALADTASPAGYTPEVTPGTTSVVEGGAVYLELSGFLAGEQVEIGVFTETETEGQAAEASPASYVRLIVWTVDSAGNARGTVTLPADITVGRHRIRATGRTSGRISDTIITVVARQGGNNGNQGTNPGTGRPSTGQPRGATDVTAELVPANWILG